jgi:hypothetical protein
MSLLEEAGPNVESCFVDLRHRCATFGTAATVVSTGIFDDGVVTLVVSAIVVVESRLENSVVEKTDVNRVDEVEGITKDCVGARHAAVKRARTILEVIIVMWNCTIGRKINCLRVTAQPIGGTTTALIKNSFCGHPKVLQKVSHFVVDCSNPSFFAL